MFGDPIPTSPRFASLSTSLSTTASNTAPPTPPSHRSLVGHDLETKGGPFQVGQPLPALHLLNMACDDALSDLSDEADGFFSLDMDVSIDQQLQDHALPTPPFIHPAVADRFDLPPSRASRDASASPHPNPALRRASESVSYSSSPLQSVGLDPVLASRSRNSPLPSAAATTPDALVASDASPRNASPPTSFGPIAPEVDQKGNLEYKLKILPPSRERFDRLATQLKWRLLEGAGLAVYEIGVLDDGTLIGLDPDSMKDSLKLLSLMAAEVGASCHVQRVLALERLDETGSQSAVALTDTHPSKAAGSDLSLRALAPHEAVRCMQPFIATAELQPHVRDDLLASGAAGSYRFDIAEQQLPIPPLPALGGPDASSPAEPAEEAQHAMSTQTKRRVLKSSLNGLHSAPDAVDDGKVGSVPGRSSRDVLLGLDQSAIVYLPSKQEKRILRAAAAAEVEWEAAEAAEAAQIEAAQRALSHTQAQERRMMAKMTRVADTVQPKTARARARARKPGKVVSDSSAGATPSDSPTPSPSRSPALGAVGATQPASATAAYAGYENVMAAFGVLSERSARTLYGRQPAERGVEGNEDGEIKGRLIVEAVVRRKGAVDSHSRVQDT